jgi:hypothetical protein
MSFIFSCHWNGRFGNRMHQYAYGMTYARKHNVQFILPSRWEGTVLFKNHKNYTLDKESELALFEVRDGTSLSEDRKKVVKDFLPEVKFIDPKLPSENYAQSEDPLCFDDLCAYHPSVFAEMSKKYLLDIFEFSDEVKETDAYKYWQSKAGTYDIAHLRRDDISNPDYNKENVQGYSVISKKSYYDAMIKFGFDPSNIEWTSDDHLREWHKDRKVTEQFSWSYPNGSEYRRGPIFDWLEDFLRLYFARNIFRANSSFSWWAAFLSPTATVYSPVLDRQVIYGRDSLEEIEVKFVKGNQPHWMYGVDDIIIND